MAKVVYEVVDAASQRDDDPAGKIKAHIEAYGAAGWELVAINPLFDVIQVVWKKSATEKRATVEKRG